MTEEAFAMFGIALAGVCTVSGLIALIGLLACGVGAFITVGMYDDEEDDNDP